VDLAENIFGMYQPLYSFQANLENKSVRQFHIINEGLTELSIMFGNFPPLRHFLKYLYVLQTSQKPKLTTPAKEKQADFWQPHKQAKHDKLPPS